MMLMEISSSGRRVVINLEKLISIEDKNDHCVIHLQEHSYRINQSISELTSSILRTVTLWTFNPSAK